MIEDLANNIECGIIGTSGSGSITYCQTNEAQDNVYLHFQNKGTLRRPICFVCKEAIVIDVNIGKYIPFKDI